MVNSPVAEECDVQINGSPNAKVIQSNNSRFYSRKPQRQGRHIAAHQGSID